MVLKRYQAGGQADDEQPWFKEKRKAEQGSWVEEGRNE
jgi:hypothetical protein